MNRDGGPRQVGEREGREVVRDRLQLEHRVLRPRRQQPRVAAPEELGRLRRSRHINARFPLLWKLMIWPELREYKECQIYIYKVRQKGEL